MVKNQNLNLYDFEQDLETYLRYFDMFELKEILKHLILYRIYLEQNTELLIENRLKRNKKKTFCFIFFYKNYLSPYAHKCPVKPSVQLHINDG